MCSEQDAVDEGGSCSGGEDQQGYLYGYLIVMLVVSVLFVLMIAYLLYANKYRSKSVQSGNCNGLGSAPTLGTTYVGSS